jgi:glycosyltransferase involved in cell wall biosynthesis
MRIVQITPGAGNNFYCENCLRDNALVLELRRRGHDTLMVPLYLPLATDGPDSSRGTPIFFGGINVYLREKYPFFCHAPKWLGRLLDSRPLLRWAARQAEMTKAKDLGEATLSMLRGEEGRQVKEIDRLIEWLGGQDRPDVIVLSNILLVGLVRRIKKELGVPVICTLQDEDAFLDGLIDPYREQAWQMVRERAAQIDAFMPVSRYYGAVMQERLDLVPERLHVAHVGIDTDLYTPAPPPLQPPERPEPPVPTIGFLGQINHAGGADLVAEAFRRLRVAGRTPGLRLRIAGGQTPGDWPYVESIRHLLAEASALADAEILPIPDQAAKRAFLRSLRVLAAPSRAAEAFAVFPVEAMACGVPVVVPRIGAFPEIMEMAGGGLLVAPEDPVALAGAIDRLLAQPAEARAMALRGREGVLEHFSIGRMADRVIKVCESLLAPKYRPER